MTSTLFPAPRSAAALMSLLGSIVLIVAACGGSSPTAAPTVAAPTAALPTAAAPSSTPVAATTTPTVALTPAPVATVTAAPPVTSPPSPTAPIPSFAALFGTPVLIGDQQAMSVLQFEQWTDPGEKPAKGYVFVTVSIRIDAIKLTSFDSADFRLRDEAGKLYKWETGRSPHLYDLADLEPGHNYVGWITYEVPKTTIAKLVLVYAPRFLAGVKFEVPLS